MSRKPYVFHTLSACAECGEREDFASPNIEAYELTGEIVCDDCADAVLERWEDENGQFGGGA